jgi:hypothetical protein
MNGGTIYSGRATPPLLAGRATGAIDTAGLTDWSAMVMNRGACGPIQRCCCKGPVNVAPGEIRSVVMNWAMWIDSVPGFAANAVVEASLYDMTVNPPAPADPTKIKVVSGTGDDPDPPDNSDVASLIALIPPYGTQAFVEVSDDATIGAQYRLNICLVARDCDGHKIRQCDCVVLVVAEC